MPIKKKKHIFQKTWFNIENLQGLLEKVKDIG